jgi:hypothetical protein
LTQANLNSTDLNSADLSGADLGDADLGGANLKLADLRGADLGHADLSHAHLSSAVLSGAKLWHTNLSGAYFEPTNFPELFELARAYGLELMTFQSNPSPLVQLRKQFQDAGFREQERAITCALNRAETERDLPVERWFRRIAFDLTSQYGLTPGRPLRIVFWLWLFCSGVYALFMHRPGPSGIYFVGTRRWRRRSDPQIIQIRPHAIRATNGWRHAFQWLKEEWRVSRAAMFFSLMSASNIGFRDINLGQWLRMLTTYEYGLKAVGWTRTVSGFQSLLSVYLIALCVLTYFGRPFG